MKTTSRTAEIAHAIAARTGLKATVEQLADALPPSELGALLLHIFRQRSQGMTFSDVMHLAERDTLTRVSNVDARLLHVVDGAALEAFAAFEAVDLSPVVPFGMNRLTGIDQNNVLTALRNAEVLSDPTTAMALECAARRKKGDRAVPTRLAASARCTRMQRLDDPSFSRHFRLFAVTSSVRAGPEETAERAELLLHLRGWLEMLELLTRRGFNIPQVRVEVTDTRLMRVLLLEQGVPLETLQGYVNPARWNEEVQKRGLRFPGVVDTLAAVKVPSAAQGMMERLGRVEGDVFAPLRAAFPSVKTVFDLRRLHGVNYYQGLAFHVVLTHANGREFQVGDGGFTTWTQSLLSDRAERLLCSAVGSEVLCKVFQGE